jgi:hypothetical protein
MNDIEYQIECTVRDLVVLLVERHNMDIKTALNTLYNSDTYTKLKDVRTGLYFQSPLYVYDFLENEITKGKMQ